MKNIGFKYVNGKMETYTQNKIILTKKYTKRPIIKNLFTRPYMPNEVPGEVNEIQYDFILKQTKKIQNKIKNRF